MFLCKLPLLFLLQKYSFSTQNHPSKKRRFNIRWLHFHNKYIEKTWAYENWKNIYPEAYPSKYYWVDDGLHKAQAKQLIPNLTMKIEKSDYIIILALSIQRRFIILFYGYSLPWVLSYSQLNVWFLRIPKLNYTMMANYRIYTTDIEVCKQCKYRDILQIAEHFVM